MKPLLAAFLAAGAVFLVIDGIWLTVMANLLYRPMIGHLIAEQFKLGPAVAFYLIYLIGLVYFRRPAGPGRAKLASGSAERRGARLRRLRHLRPHQPRRDARLAGSADRDRHGLGHGPHRARRHRRLLRREEGRRLGVSRGTHDHRGLLQFVMLGLVPSIHVLTTTLDQRRRGWSPQGRP